MNLDPRTIVFIIILSTVLMSASMLSVWKVYFSRIIGVRHWAVAVFLQSIGWAFYAFRGYIPDFLSIVAANTLIILSVAMFFNVLARFLFIKISALVAYIPVVSSVIFLSYFTYVVPDIVARIIIQSANGCVLMLACCYVILSQKDRPTSHSFTAAIFGLSGIVLIARIIAYPLAFFTPAESIFAHNIMQDISYVSFYVTAVMLTFGFILMSNDRYIIENNKTEGLLLKSEERYRNIVETSQEGIWLVDADYRTVFVNKKMTEILGYSMEEMLSLDGFHFMDETDMNLAVESRQRRMSGISEIMERRLKTKTGKLIWASISATPIMLNEGKFSGSLAMVTDITDRFQASEKLKHNEKQLKEAQKIAHIGNYSYDFITRLWKCSEVVDEMSGLTREEIPDFDNWVALMAPEFKQQYLKELEDTIIHAKPNFGHYQDYKILRAHTGEERWISITGEIEYDTSGNPISLFGTLQDVTGRKMEEKQLQELNIQLRNLSSHLQTVREEERMHIAREIHDELGQQLTVLKMDIFSLKNKMNADSPLMQKKINHMIEMVDTAIQTLKRIATELRPGILDHLGLVAALEWNAKEFQKRSGIRCNFNSGAVSENFSTQINTTVFRIFQESLTNVARHSKANLVEAKLYEKESMLILEVNDNGVGIRDSNKKTSWGLLGMKERAIILHGDFSIKELEEGGTNVTLKIPLSC
ncbi:MAG: domain S-box protein [Bacteroidota bacterium]|nr:domain S-box protein [Bacteroidota bacterium]